MNDKPIIFSGAMVKATMAGEKTQHRLPITWVKGIGKVTEFQKSDTPGYDWIMRDKRMHWNDLRHNNLLKRCPYPVGTRLWVRETWGVAPCYNDKPPAALSFLSARNVDYKADPRRYQGVHVDKWRPSIHMPRWASRITLEVTGVKVERVQEISEEDARAGGVEAIPHVGPMRAFGWKDYSGGIGFFRAAESFRTLWDSIYASRGYSWDANPWVWCLEFKRVEGGDA